VSPSLDGAPVSLAALLAAYRGRPLAVREAAPRSKSRTNLVDSAPWPTIDISPSSTMRSPAWTCTWPPRSSRPLASGGSISRTVHQPPRGQAKRTAA